MATGLGEAGELARAAREADEIESKVQRLLDELVTTLARSPPQGALEERSAMLALEASRLASALSETDELELNEKAIVLERLSRQTSELLAHAPDAIVAGEHEKWSGELEAAVSHLHSLRASLRQLSLPHVTGFVRNEHEAHAKRHLLGARAKLKLAHDAIMLKKHVGAHPIHVQLTRVKKAIDSVRSHYSRASSRRMSAQQMGAVEEAAVEIGRFFSRELNGRLHVDWHTIQLRSDLTGAVAQWPHDDVHGQALDAVLAGSGLEEMLSGVRKRRTTLAGKFECKSDANGLLVQLDAGERTILGGNVMYKPMTARIYV